MRAQMGFREWVWSFSGEHLYRTRDWHHVWLQRRLDGSDIWECMVRGGDGELIRLGEFDFMWE